MLKIRGLKIEEYVYDSRKERDAHVFQMESEGWEASGQIREQFVGENDLRWYARFSRYDKVSPTK